MVVSNHNSWFERDHFRLSSFLPNLFEFVSPRKRSRIFTLSDHTSMAVKNIEAAIGVGKSIGSRIINNKNNFGQVLPNGREIANGNVR